MLMQQNESTITCSYLKYKLTNYSKTNWNSIKKGTQILLYKNVRI